MSNPVVAVKERMDGGRLWTQGTLGDIYGRGPVCVFGAIKSATPACRSLVEDAVSRVIAEQYPERDAWMIGHNRASIPAFNDADDTDWPAVELVLDKAAVLWDEAHS